MPLHRGRGPLGLRGGGPGRLVLGRSRGARAEGPGRRERPGGLGAVRGAAAAEGPGAEDLLVAAARLRHVVRVVAALGVHAGDVVEARNGGVVGPRAALMIVPDRRPDEDPLGHGAGGGPGFEVTTQDLVLGLQMDRRKRLGFDSGLMRMHSHRQCTVHSEGANPTANPHLRTQKHAPDRQHRPTHLQLHPGDRKCDRPHGTRTQPPPDASRGALNTARSARTGLTRTCTPDDSQRAHPAPHAHAQQQRAPHGHLLLLGMAQHSIRRPSGSNLHGQHAQGA